MYFRMPCWKCGKTLRASDENIGKKAKCPYCGAVDTIRQPDVVPTMATVEAAEGEPPPGDSGMPAPSGRQEGGQSKSTNISLALTMIVGLGVTAGFYAVVMLLPPDNYIRVLCTKRSWQPPLMVYMTFWALSMLVFKYRNLRVQRAALLFDVLPSEVADEIHPNNVEAFRSNILGLPVEPGKSFLIGRVLRALNYYKVHPTTEGVSTLLANQSNIEASIVDSSYTFIRTLVWAIPILGFIGTVQGLGEALGHFSGIIGEAAGYSAVKGKLGGVTSGLSIAFDATLVALLMSLVIMLPASALQKAEEDLLAAVDQYCNENVLRRLRDQVTTGPDGDAAQRLLSAADAAIAQHTASLNNWAKGMRDTIAEFTTQVTDACGSVRQSLEEGHRSDLANWARGMEDMSNRAVTRIADAWGSMRTSMEQVQRSELSAAGAGIASLSGPVMDLQRDFSSMAQQASQIAASQQQIASMLQQLRVGAEAASSDGGLKDALADLGGHLDRSGQLLEVMARRMDVDLSAVTLKPMPDDEDGGAHKRRWWKFGAGKDRGGPING